MPRLSKGRARRHLQKALDEIPALKQLRRGSPQFEEWRRDTRLAIEHTFKELPSRVNDFSKIRYSPVVYLGAIPESNLHETYIEGLGRAAETLELMIGEVEEYWDDDDQETESPVASATPEQTNTNQVIIIHGRDHGTRGTVARFLEDLELEVVILQEKPDEGRTIIEKFEAYAEIDFAVALFTLGPVHTT